MELRLNFNFEKGSVVLVIAPYCPLKFNKHLGRIFVPHIEDCTTNIAETASGRLEAIGSLLALCLAPEDQEFMFL
jgi:hypothetical protein